MTLTTERTFSLKSLFYLRTAIAAIVLIGAIIAIAGGVGVTAIMLALTFEFLTGFHNTGNTVASIKYSKVLPMIWAIWGSALFTTLGGLLVGTGVALFVTGLVPVSQLTGPLLICLLLSASAWNLFTWYFGLPVASSHCLISALIGAGMASAIAKGEGPLSGVNLLGLAQTLDWSVCTPLIGFAVCLVFALLLKQLCTADNATNQNRMRRLLPALQIASAAAVSFAEGANNGQKVMGVTTLILVSQFSGYDIHHVALWVVWAASLTIGLGTLLGGIFGERMMKTFGEKLSPRGICRVQGACTQLTTAIIVLGASMLSIPASSTQVQVSANIGANAGLHGPHATPWRAVSMVLLGWLLTWFVPAMLAAVLYLGFYWA